MSKQCSKEHSVAVAVRVPGQSNDSEPVVISRLLVQEGDDVHAGTALAEVETAKSAVEIEAPQDGTVLRLLAIEGSEMPVHAPLVIIGQPGDDISHLLPATDDGADAHHDLETRPTANGRSDLSRDPRQESPTGDVTEVPPSLAPDVLASPRARVLAARHDLDLTTVPGSGPNGYVLATDVRARVRAREGGDTTPTTQPASRPDQVAPAIARQPAPAEGQVPLSRIRRITAERMVASLTTAAQLTLHARADATTLLALYRRLRTASESHEISAQPKITINDLILFVASRVVLSHPELNAHFSWDGIQQFSSVALGMAVDTPRGLLVARIDGAEQLTLSQLADHAHELAEKAQSGALPPDLAGGSTFTVTNLGAHGIDYFTPVLNLPEVAILGVGAIGPTLLGDPPEPTQTLPLSLTFDHRAADGVTAARLLKGLCDGLGSIDLLLAR